MYTGAVLKSYSYVSAIDGQPDSGVHYITMSCTACSYINYSNTTHFHVGHIDEVSVCSNGGISDSKLTRTWNMPMERKNG